MIKNIILFLFIFQLRNSFTQNIKSSIISTSVMNDSLVIEVNFKNYGDVIQFYKPTIDLANCKALRVSLINIKTEVVSVLQTTIQEDIDLIMMTNISSVILSEKESFSLEYIINKDIFNLEKGEYNLIIELDYNDLTFLSEIKDIEIFNNKLKCSYRLLL